MVLSVKLGFSFEKCCKRFIYENLVLDFVNCKVCNKDKPIRANGLCSSCYFKEYRKKLASKGTCISCKKYKISNHSKYYCGRCLARMKHNQQLIREKKKLGIET